jgi:hypothetical protein
MSAKRFGAILLLVAALAAACGGSDDDGEVSLEDPIGAPPAGAVYQPEPSGAGSSGTGASVQKSATVDISVLEEDLTTAAQAVVDLATSEEVGGYLVSSVVDVNDGYGAGSVSVKVPSAHFEPVVGRLGDIGDVTRQQLQGEDLTPQVLSAREEIRRTEKTAAGLRRDAARAKDEATRLQLLDNLRRAKENLRTLRDGKRYVATQTAFANVAVALTAQAPVAPKKPAFEQALTTAKDITLAIASGAVIAAGVLLPIGVLLLAIYFIALVVVRRVRPRLET